MPDEVIMLEGDIRDRASARKALGDREFDAVVDFVVMTEEQLLSDIELFTNRTGQYVFISSASAYQTPLARLPITESTPLCNPLWEYSRNKIACEDALARAYRERGFPSTVVRPSHTYDKTGVPILGGWTVIERMRQNKPVVVHGDGTSLWVLTHHDDFARAFVRLLGNARAIGDTFHITSDEVLTWDQIHEVMAHAAGTKARLVHVSSEAIARVLPEWGPGLLGERAFSHIFDNRKIRGIAPGWVATIPFAQGAGEIIDWFDSDPSRKHIDERVDSAMDTLVNSQR
jgi:nucleoside-diphosphate-sugar epimerase